MATGVETRMGTENSQDMRGGQIKLDTGTCQVWQAVVDAPVGAARSSVPHSRRRFSTRAIGSEARRELHASA